MSNIFSIGISGLNAAKASLDLTSHNISNVNTDGYNRQVLTQSAAPPQFAGYGYVGSGVDLNSVSRLYDGFMDKQLQGATAGDSGYQTQLTALNDIDNLVSDGSAGISNVMQGFYSSIQTLGSQPSSIAARQSVISQAQSVASRFGSMNTRLNELRNGLINTVSASVDSVNAYAKQISQLNQQIINLGQGDGRAPNDLLDQRDNLVLKLNKLIKTDSVQQSDGTYNIFVGQGQPLVLGNSSYDMVMSRGAPAQPEDPEAPSISVKLPGGTMVALDSTLLSGGSIAGAMTTLTTDLPRVQSDLGRMAIEFSDAVNRQHALGVDLNGQLPTSNFFTDLSAQRTAAETATTPAGQAKALRAALSSFSVILQDPSKLAVSSNLQAAKATPSGTPSVTSIWQVSNLSPATNPVLPAAPALTLKYQPANVPPALPFAADYGGTAIVVTQSATQPGVYQFTVPVGPLATDVANIAFKYEGQATTNQDIVISPRSGAVTASAQLDNANLLEMGRLQTRQLMAATPSTGNTFMPTIGAARTANSQSFYGQMVSYVGSRTNVIQVSQQSQEAALQEVKLRKESFSGVNLDEEAANLMRYQQAYQASSKVIQVAQEMFKTVLGIA